MVLCLFILNRKEIKNNMKERIKIINPDSFLKAVSKMTCERPFAHLEATDFEIPYSNIEAPEGFLFPTNKETGEEFPNCCLFHADIFRIANDRYTEFPYCCPSHKKLANAVWFNKENYADAPIKVVTLFEYTAHQIKTYIDKPNWFKEITDYIDACVSTFGQLPEGYGCPVCSDVYLNQVEHFIDNTKVIKIDVNKKKRLNNFIQSYFEIKSSDNPSTDLNILYEIYKKWLNIFPFQLSIFKDQEKNYRNRFPILKGKPIHNKYSKSSKNKLLSKEELIDFLEETTNHLLSTINSLVIYEKGELTNPVALNLSMVIESRRLELNESLKNSSPNEDHRFRAILKNWFEGEKRFLREITPLIQQIETGTHQNGNKNNNDRTPIEFDNRIFTSERAYRIFSEFKETLITNETEYADYSFLYYVMKKDRFLHDIRQLTFIEYLSESQDSQIASKGYKQFKFSTTPKKEKTYKNIKARIQ